MSVTAHGNPPRTLAMLPEGASLVQPTPPKDGGPAFPVAWPMPNVPEPGMSLRDYFAARALPEALKLTQPPGMPPEDVAGFAAKVAYRIADAMIAERS